MQCRGPSATRTARQLSPNPRRAQRSFSLTRAARQFFASAPSAQETAPPSNYFPSGVAAADIIVPPTRASRLGAGSLRALGTDGEEDEGHQQQEPGRDRLHPREEEGGRKIKKAANATDTTVRAKRITLPGQVLGAEGKGAAVTQRGLSLPELLGQCAHYSERVRKDALDGIAELLQAHPEALVASAATVVEKVAERLVDREKVAARRRARRPQARRPPRPRPARPRAVRPRAHPARRRRAHARPPRRPTRRAGALDAILDVAPDLVAANDPAATLGHLAELLRRGDDAASSALVAETDKARAENATSDDRDDYGARSDARGGLSRAFGDMTASRVGPQAPDARLRLLTSCRRFLEVLARRHGRASDGWGTAIDGSTDRSTEPATTTWRWGPDVGRDFGGSDDAFGGSTNGGGDGPSSGSPLARGIAGYPSGAEHGAGAALHAYRATRAPPGTRSASAAASGGGGAERRRRSARFRSVRFRRRRRARGGALRGVGRGDADALGRGERRARCACEA